MRFHQPLTGILNNRAKVRILRFLCRKGGQWSGRGLAAELSLNPVTAHRALRSLHQETLLDLRRSGPLFLYSLRDDQFIVRELLRPLFEREEEALNRLSERVKGSLGQSLKPHVAAAAFYGSVARGEESPTSDVDLLILVKSEILKRRIRESLSQLSERIERECGNPVSLYVTTVQEARRKLRQGLPLFKNILKSHRLIWGTPLERLLHGNAA